MANIILVKHPKNWGLDQYLQSGLIDKFLVDILQQKKLNNVEVSLSFVGRKKAKDLNMKYRNKSYIPQVLGFPISRTPDGDGVTRLGDIVICTQKLKYESGFQNKSIKQVLQEWLDHGVENLLI